MPASFFNWYATTVHRWRGWYCVNTQPSFFFPEQLRRNNSCCSANMTQGWLELTHLWRTAPVEWRLCCPRAWGGLTGRCAASPGVSPSCSGCLSESSATPARWGSTARCSAEDHRRDTTQQSVNWHSGDNTGDKTSCEGAAALLSSHGGCLIRALHLLDRGHGNLFSENSRCWVMQSI